MGVACRLYLNELQELQAHSLGHGAGRETEGAPGGPVFPPCLQAQPAPDGRASDPLSATPFRASNPGPHCGNNMDACHAD